MLIIVNMPTILAILILHIKIEGKSELVSFHSARWEKYKNFYIDYIELLLTI